MIVSKMFERTQLTLIFWKKIITIDHKCWEKTITNLGPVHYCIMLFCYCHFDKEVPRTQLTFHMHTHMHMHMHMQTHLETCLIFLVNEVELLVDSL